MSDIPADNLKSLPPQACEFCHQPFNDNNPPIMLNKFHICAKCHQKIQFKGTTRNPANDSFPPRVKPSTKFILFGIPLLVIGYLIFGMLSWPVGVILANIGWFLFSIGVLIKVISQGIREVNRK